jgi:hypothetical protein
MGNINFALNVPTTNVIKLVNSLVFLSVFVTLWQEKIATKALKHIGSQRN